MKDLLEKFLDIKAKIKALEDEKLSVEIALYELHQEKLNEKAEGTFNFACDNYNLKIVKKETITVDQDLADVIGVGFRRKYDLDKTVYKSLSAEDKKRVDECLTTKPSKPSFSVEIKE